MQTDGNDENDRTTSPKEECEVTWPRTSPGQFPGMGGTEVLTN